MSECGITRIRRRFFEDFKFTGLSNFSFLEMDFINEAPTEETAPHG